MLVWWLAVNINLRQKFFIFSFLIKAANVKMLNKL